MQSKFYILMGIKKSGKTTLGRSLAKKLGTSFIDIDDVIEKIFQKEHGRDMPGIKSCRDIYRSKGKSFFQDLEYKAILQIRKTWEQKKDRVVSLGGGIADNSEALCILRDFGIKIYLESDPKLLFERIKRQGLPPFLEGENPYELFSTLYTRRSGIYRTTADITVNISNKDLNNSLEALINSIKTSSKENSNAG